MIPSGLQKVSSPAFSFLKKPEASTPGPTIAVPDDVLPTIFAYCNLGSINACQRVCRQWRNAAQQPELWNIFANHLKLDLIDQKEPKKHVQDFCQKNPVTTKRLVEEVQRFLETPPAPYKISVNALKYTSTSTPDAYLYIFKQNQDKQGLDILSSYSKEHLEQCFQLTLSRKTIKGIEAADFGNHIAVPTQQQQRDSLSHPFLPTLINALTKLRLVRSLLLRSLHTQRSNSLPQLIIRKSLERTNCVALASSHIDPEIFQNIITKSLTLK